MRQRLVLALMVMLQDMPQRMRRIQQPQHRSAAGLLGIVTAPLLHGSWEHLAANSVAILVLGTLAGSVYPRATARALPII